MITTLYELADFINEQDSLNTVEIEAIIEKNGWESLCGVDSPVIARCGESCLIINEHGFADVQ